MKTQKILKRLKKAKYLSENLDRFKNQLEKSIIGTENARTEMLNRNKQKNPIQSNHEPAKTTNHLRWRKDQTHWKQANTER